MIRLALLLSLAMPALAGATCYADYKAKRDDPLRLHYGVAQISGPCDADSALAELTPRLEAQGWHLLTVIGTFDDSGLEERKDSAGEYFLSF